MKAKTQEDTSGPIASAEIIRAAIERLPWRSALPADGMPAHQYVVLGRCPADAWDVLDAAVRDRLDGYDAYFRGYLRPMHYCEFEGHRYWRTAARGTVHMLNRCTLDSVEPPRRVDEGATAAEAWDGPPWAPDGTPWPPGYVPGPGPAHLRGMVYRAELDPRAAFPCAVCGISYWLFESDRPCPRCGSAPAPSELAIRGLTDERTAPRYANRISLPAVSAPRQRELPEIARLSRMPSLIRWGPSSSGA